MIRCRTCGIDRDICDCHIDYTALEYDKKYRKKMKVNGSYILLALAVILAGIFCFLYFSKTKQLNEYEASFNERSQIVTETNKKVVDSLKKQNTTLAASVIKYRSRFDSLQKIDKEIVYKYKLLRNENRLLTDSAQLGLTLRLLANYDRLGVIIGD